MGKNAAGREIFQFNALSICRKLMLAISCKEITEGYLHSVFENACNIDTDAGLVTLLNEDREMAPLSIRVGNGKRSDFRKIGLDRYTMFEFNRSGLVCRSENVYVRFTDACLWSSGIPLNSPGYSCSEIGRRLKLLENRMSVSCKFSGMGELIGELCAGMPELGLSAGLITIPGKTTGNTESISSTEFIKSRFLEFIQAIRSGDTDLAVQKAGGIIGYGPGLTPSMDDFLSGMMISFMYMGKCFGWNTERISGFNRMIAAEGTGRTTRLSTEMLKHAAEGETNQALDMLMCAIIDFCDNENILTEALHRTVKIGETSGSDMVFGLYVGCKLMMNSELRGEWLDESVC